MFPFIPDQGTLVTSSMFLTKTEIHLWKICLNRFPPIQLLSWLDPTEQQRAQQLKSGTLYHRYVTAHAAMRDILSKYLGGTPADINFIQPPNQKPSIDSTQNQIDLEFSLSHSHETAILALSRSLVIGVDIEHIRNILDIAQLAKRFFTLSEYKIILGSPPDKQLSLFFKIWTAKEAFLKAKGLGISNHLAQFSVKLNNHQEPISICRSEFDIESWTLQRLATFPEYESTLAIESKSMPQLIYFNWNKTGPIQKYL